MRNRDNCYIFKQKYNASQLQRPSMNRLVSKTHNNHRYNYIINLSPFITRSMHVHMCDTLERDVIIFITACMHVRHMVLSIEYTHFQYSNCHQLQRLQRLQGQLHNVLLPTVYFHYIGLTIDLRNRDCKTQWISPRPTLASLPVG